MILKIGSKIKMFLSMVLFTKFMAWKFVPSDKFSLAQLLYWEQFFIQDLQYAEDYLAYVKKHSRLMRKTKTGQSYLSIAEKDVQISKDNLAKVKQAIKIARANNM